MTDCTRLPVSVSQEGLYFLEAICCRPPSSQSLLLGRGFEPICHKSFMALAVLLLERHLNTWTKRDINPANASTSSASFRNILHLTNGHGNKRVDDKFRCKNNSSTDSLSSQVHLWILFEGKSRVESSLDPQFVGNSTRNLPAISIRQF